MAWSMMALPPRRKSTCPDHKYERVDTKVAVQDHACIALLVNFSPKKYNNEQITSTTL